jgi:hypothetical protein
LIIPQLAQPAVAPVLGSFGFPEDRPDDLTSWTDDTLYEIAAELTLGYRLDQVTGKPLPEQSFKGEFLNFTL